MTGQKVILPASFTGSPRDFHWRYQDSVVRCHGKPDLLIAIACSPNWLEAHEAFHPGNKPRRRPDILARILNLPSQSNQRPPKSRYIAKSVAHLYVVEF